jgi:antitoxin (DNA-binding transcriptional repressor) of toxin-antitoxin stability system
VLILRAGKPVARLVPASSSGMPTRSIVCPWAQAAMEKMALLTADPEVMAYDEAETIWASKAEPPRARRRPRR